MTVRGKIRKKEGKKKPRLLHESGLVTSIPLNNGYGIGGFTGFNTDLGIGGFTGFNTDFGIGGFTGFKTDFPLLPFSVTEIAKFVATTRTSVIRSARKRFRLRRADACLDMGELLY